MNTIKTIREIEILKSKLDALDLDPIKIKLMHAEEGEGWSREYVDLVEIEYKRFLFLTATQEMSIVPIKDVDTFWHQHILDTRKYAQDCERIFGGFLHHFPYFGMRGEEDAKNLSDSFEQTKRIYESTYGVAFGNALSAAQNCSSCGPNSCSGSGCVNSTCSGKVNNDLMQVEVRPTFQSAVLH